MSFVVEQERDHVPGRLLVGLGMGTLVAIGVSVGIVVLSGGGYDVPVEAPSSPDAVLFIEEAPGERQERLATEKLSTWEWTDRAAGRARVPIDVAIELYVAQEAGKEAAP